MARRIRREPQLFLPDYPDQVRAIAMRGLSDEEMAKMFGVSSKVFAGWKRYYASFREAIEQGRSTPDVEVVQSLHHKAIGAITRKTVPIKLRRETRRGKDVDIEEFIDYAEVEEQHPPDTPAIKYWLSNRQSKYWSDRSHVQHSGKAGEPDIGVGIKDETKHEVMNSILNLIQPKPDGDEED